VRTLARLLAVALGDAPMWWHWLPGEVWKPAVWLLDEALDQVPAREGGVWRRYGYWGCRLRLSRWWDPGAAEELGA
jgi:hypothetical protein